MFKDRLILAVLLCAFVALAACDAFDDDDEKTHFPDRAPSANNLLRHYYDSNTWPKNFTAIKIPEGDDFDDNELTIEMPMGGTDPVNDVRVRLYVVPPHTQTDNGVELECRVKAPGGTTSGWQRVDFQDLGEDGLGAVNAQAEVRFANEFEFTTSGETSGGLWRIQLRDPVEDNDGRALFRNATLRLNGGFTTGGSELQNADLGTNPYDKPLPVRKGKNYDADIAWIGVDRVMRVRFDFTSSFEVQGFNLEFTIRHNGSASPADDLRMCLISPSGGWFLPNKIPDPEATFVSTTPGDDTTWVRYILTRSRATAGIGDSFIFLGEPAGGTWTLLLWEKEDDGNAIWLSDKRALDGTTLQDGMEAVLDLS